MGKKLKGRRVVAKLELRAPAKIDHSKEVQLRAPAAIKDQAGVVVVMPQKPRSKRKKTT